MVAKIKGTEVQALVDTGCSRTLVRARPEWQAMGQMLVRCIHGDVKPCQWMDEEVMVAGVTQKLRIGVVPNLVQEMLLGRDWKGLEKLPKEEGFAITEEGLQGDLKEILNIDKRQVIAWQQDDESLQEWLQKAQPAGEEGKWLMKEGLLYEKDGTGEALVVPRKLRSAVLKLAHDIPSAGHLMVEKTMNIVKQRFAWPQMRKDVENYCKTCPECQKTQTKPAPGALMIPMPLVDKPFDRIGIDIVGPLTRSAAGHTHILVIVDYATRYPEVIPLRTTHAKVLAKELMGFFPRVGFPKEILTDQGSNFMSSTLKHLWGMLKVHPLKTSVYHPQTNGLTERFNKTLKGMLRKLVTEKPQQWHLLLNPLMFAVREVPQASTGFSPFELLYGRNPRGVLDLLKDQWEQGESDAQTTVKQVLEMREHLETTQTLAKQALQSNQKQQKRRYDQRVKPRTLEPGQKVLLLLPSDSAKLFAQWQGPYEVIRQVSPVDYEIKMHDKKKHSNIRHKFVKSLVRERSPIWRSGGRESRA